MKSTRTLMSAGLLLGAMPVLATAQDFNWHGRLAPGKTLEIRGVNGAIDASGGAGEAEVRAT